MKHEEPNTQQDLNATDPLGPIALPKRSKIGARALALVGTVGMGTFALAVAVEDTCSTWPTIHH
ncbi:hypothetical protein HPO96_13655 [Kribbella sandramycini]|uniref:Uncharacterized protein n=1 Tax=Kribbella sandramycini TaxID=60450 RepID=A0A7Y4KZ13_9ACTN|nr:hypothetical protein [Kribbella sandramycini]MBB6565021.1 hypothetical protein [Kribbella sandramycini]NOL41293.1 hypothetical protein [Kribbella sandramycini]